MKKLSISRNKKIGSRQAEAEKNIIISIKKEAGNPLASFSKL